MPPRRPALRPRKLPRQQRARDTVDVILQAATYILRRSGYDAMTTNQIAGRAGVNIASLYQYFPNKQAIVAALVQRHVDRLRAAIAPVLARPRSARLADQVRALIELMAAEHAIEPELHALFTAIAPELGLGPVATAADTEIEAGYAVWLRDMRGRVPDPALALWIARTAVHAVFHTALVERPDAVRSPVLIDELVRLVTGFLDPPPTA
ncbi:MAG TPA: TetR/AcrR family transcriptional regulator [Kofleriaceae bacterium]